MMTDEDLREIANLVVRDLEPGCPSTDQSYALKLFDETMRLRAGILAALLAGQGEASSRILREAIGQLQPSR